MKPYRFITALVTAPALFATLVAAHVPSDCRVIDTKNPTDETDDQYVCREDVFLHAADVPVGNLAATGEADLPSWDTASPGDTGGAAYVATIPNEPLPPPGNDERLSEATFEGTYTGNIDKIAGTMYVAAHANPVLPLVTTMATDLTLTVDGHELFGARGLTRFTAVGNGLFRADWAFTGVYPVMRGLGLDGNDVEHTIRIGLEPDWPTTFVFDNAQVPSGLVFNIESIDGYWEVPIG